MDRVEDIFNGDYANGRAIRAGRRDRRPNERNVDRPLWNEVADNADANYPRVRRSRLAVVVLERTSSRAQGKVIRAQVGAEMLAGDRPIQEMVNRGRRKGRRVPIP